MTNTHNIRLRLRVAALCILFTLTIAGPACKHPGPASARVFRTGEQAQIGQLVFTVLDAEWKSQIEDAMAPRYPAHRFLVVGLTITNSGATETTLPHLVLQDAKGKTYPEVAEAAGVPDWLGLLRPIRPVETVQGRIVFDVPLGAYQLRVTDDPAHAGEKYALVEIPLRIEPEAGAAPVTPVPVPDEK